MAGLGYRREMSGWDMAQVKADFFEVIAENWIRRERDPLHRLIASGRPVHLHGVSLNLGGTSPLCTGFLQEVRGLMDDLQTPFYSDHLAASGDAHQLYDLFPIPFTQTEVKRVGERIKQVQDILGCRIGIENPTWYSNIGDIPEPDFLMSVADYADCNLLLDLNNVDVNFKNHGKVDINHFLQCIDFSRVTYLHVAGHEYDDRFGLYVDTHSQPVQRDIQQTARALSRQYDLPILLEWDNDIPDMNAINQELQCLHSTIM